MVTEIEIPGMMISEKRKGIRMHSVLEFSVVEDFRAII